MESTKRELVYFIDNYSCRNCNTPLASSIESHDGFATLDHKVPIAKGGTNKLKNLQLYCWNCNHAKGKSDFEGYYKPKYIYSDQDVVNVPEKEILFRGDTRVKGLELCFNENLKDFKKNKAEIFYFTDKHCVAYEYATETMNFRLRKNYNDPHITAIYLKEKCKMLNGIISADKVSPGQSMFRLLDSHLYNGDMTVEDYALISTGRGLSEFKYQEDVQSTRKDFEKLKAGINVIFSLPMAHLLNDNSGVVLKRKLIEKGFDGVIFEDIATVGIHFAFVTSNKLQILKQYPVPSHWQTILAIDKRHWRDL